MVIVSQALTLHFTWLSLNPLHNPMIQQALLSSLSGEKTEAQDGPAASQQVAEVVFKYIISLTAKSTLLTRTLSPSSPWLNFQVQGKF